MTSAITHTSAADIANTQDIFGRYATAKGDLPKTSDKKTNEIKIKKLINILIKEQLKKEKK